MRALAGPHRVWAIVVVVLLVVVVALVVTRPTQQPIPQIIDEHGNNLVYQCPSPDPRCNPTPTPGKP